MGAFPEWDVSSTEQYTLQLPYNCTWAETALVVCTYIHIERGRSKYSYKFYNDTPLTVVAAVGITAGSAVGAKMIGVGLVMMLPALRIMSVILTNPVGLAITAVNLGFFELHCLRL